MSNKSLFATLLLVVAAVAVSTLVIFQGEVKSLQGQASGINAASRNHAGFEDFWSNAAAPLIRDSYCIGHCDYDFDYCAYYATYYCFHKGVLNIRACLIHGGRQCSERYRACTYLCENPNQTYGNTGTQNTNNNNNNNNNNNQGTVTNPTQTQTQTQNP